MAPSGCSVSYTHLDVYKRQVQISGVGNSTGVALAEVYEVSFSGTQLANICLLYTSRCV